MITKFERKVIAGLTAFLMCLSMIFAVPVSVNAEAERTQDEAVSGVQQNETVKDVQIPDGMSENVPHDIIAGDEAADAIVKKIIRKIAVVIANTVLMLNSEMVILGGDSEIFTEENIVEIKKILEKVCPFVPEVVTSKLGADAPIIGGIKVALDYAEEQIIMLWKS